MLKVSRIFLVGPMGTGKTSIGSRLSRALGCSFVDTDAEIEKRTGVKIDVIFDIEGEDGFENGTMRGHSIAPLSRRERGCSKNAYQHFQNERSLRLSTCPK